LAGPGDSLALGPFREIWDKAESRIKRTEHLRTSLTIPAVNELRYAGYHLLRALTYNPSAGDEDTPEVSLGKGTLHCRRATYDAVDAEAMLYLERAKRFEQDYRDVSIDVPNFNYMAVRAQIREARDLMLEARSAYESRDAYHQRIMEHCDKLRSAVDLMDDARIELNKKKDSELRTKRNFKIVVTVSILAAIAAASGWAKVYLDRAGAAVPHATETQSASDAGR
jgi:hypothetical protein